MRPTTAPSNHHLIPQPRATGKVLAAALGVQDGYGHTKEIASCTISKDDHSSYGERVSEARAWLETQSAGVPA
jgi:hypothetical protein